MNFPVLVFLVSFVGLWLSEWAGASFRKEQPKLEKDEREDFNLIAAATLTLLGLIIGFTFSMAISRYDQRKSGEEAETNAISTEYRRADLLIGADAAKVRMLLRNYLDQRVLFYSTADERQLAQIESATSGLEDDLWSSVQASAAERPNAMASLAVSGMNDVLNAQGETQAAWLNRIPTAAWGLMGAIAICSGLLIGYGVRRNELKAVLFLVLPLVVSISFFLIADIDSPRRGVIRVRPENLQNLSQSLHRRQP